MALKLLHGYPQRTKTVKAALCFAVGQLFFTFHKLMLFNKGLKMKPTQCTITGFWFVTGYVTGRKYWGATPRDCEQNAQLYFYR
jgi:negative regulator of replication initiation